MVLIIVVLCSTSISAQKTEPVFDVKGKVIDSNGEPLIGVTITLKDTVSTRGALTDGNGNFLITKVPKGSMLTFTYIGYVKTEKKYEGQDELVAILLEDVKSLNEVEIVAFGTQKKGSVVGAITTIAPAELKVASSNLTSSFAGRMAGIISYQQSGEPGADNAAFFIRGVTTFGYNKNPLILIDNVELGTTDLARLSPDDIESFSIMKDATATALYGARGANGVIYVKTKEGRKGKAKLNIRVENSFSDATQELQMADAVTYMKLYNEAVLTRDPSKGLYFSQDKIDRTVAGSGSLIYPATDWKQELLKNYTTNQRANLNISGGGDVARYYVAASLTQDNGILKQDQVNNFNTNIKLKKYSLRSNINIDVTKSTELIVRLSGAFDEYTGPVTSGTSLYNMVMQSSPVLFPAKYPVDQEHKYVGHILFGNAEDGKYLNPYAEMVRGYKEYERSNMEAQMELKQNLDFVTKGLSLRGLMNVSRISYYDQSRMYNPYYYGLSSYDYYTGEYHIAALNENSTDAYKGTEYLTDPSTTRTLATSSYIEGAVDYNKDFGKSGVSGLLVLQMNSRRYPNANDLQASLPYKNMGLSGRLTYSYDDKYFSEFNFGYNGSERFSEDKRWGFFPSLGIGWLISKEKFFEPLQESVSKLKLRFSYGLVGNDNIGSERFYYLSQVSMDSPYKSAGFGYEQGGYSQDGVSITRYSNPSITWEKAKKTNYALELGLWKNELELILEYYTENRTNILQQRTNISSTVGLSSSPYANIGEAEGKGIDISLNYNKVLNKKMWIQGRFNFTYAKSKFTRYEELTWINETWKSRIGYPTTQQWGYIAEGLFIDDAEVANSPKQFGNYGAGDIKYRDLNNDGVITEADMAPIGYPTTPEITYGFGSSLGISKWDISFFFQGSARSSFWLDYSSMSPFFQSSGSNGAGGDYGNNRMTTINNLAQMIANSYWSEDNRDASAVWPRLSTTSISNNNKTNTWFMRNGSFLRLKQVEIGYNFSKSIIKKAKIETLRLYLSGTNLLSFSAFKDWDVEMAGNGLGYPLQRVFNIGLNITF
ncbi:MAG: TonB-dependent receptor [Paludibacteraceae bacterium]